MPPMVEISSSPRGDRCGHMPCTDLRTMSRRDLFGCLCGALAVLGLGLAGCGSSPVEPTPGAPTATITFVPKALAVDGLTLTTATLHLDHIRALGDAPPSSPPSG